MQSAINTIRSFNRFYTDVLGLHQRHLLNSRYTLAEVRIMLEISHNLNITASELTQKLTIDKGYLSRIITKLEKLKLITRQLLPQDRRSQVIQLTTLGQTEFNQLNQASSDQIKHLTQPLKPKELQQLVENMESIQQLLNPSFKTK